MKIEHGKITMSDGSIRYATRVTTESGVKVTFSLDANINAKGARVRTATPKQAATFVPNP